MSRYAVGLLALVLTGCDVLGPSVDLMSAHPLDPVPDVYAAWYAEAEECLGAAGDFGALVWYVADEIRVDGVTKAGVLESRRRVTIRTDFAALEWVVKHEMVHHITGIGDALHDEWGRNPCEH